jgi:coenzyme PQQ precursor peptide PqqA
MARARRAISSPLLGELDPRLPPLNTRRRRASEWHTPTIEETESGMEVTSYLPAELDRA